MALITILLLRVIEPIALIFGAYFWRNFMSLVYLLLFVISPFVRLPTDGKTGPTNAFLIVVIVISALMTLGHIIFHVSLIVMSPYGHQLINCGTLETAARHVGFLKLDTVKTITAVRLLAPDLVVLICSVIVYAILQIFSRRGYEMNEEKDMFADYNYYFSFAGKYVSLLLLVCAASIQPSIPGAVYFITFLGAMNWWACNRDLGTAFAYVLKVVMWLMVLNVCGMCVVQWQYVQDVVHDHTNLYFRFLATGASFRHIAFEFRLGRRTVSMIIYDTCSAIVREFGPEVMPPPTEEHLKNVVERYYLLWKFPNCIGAIDGRHCELKCTPHSGSSYFNYLKYFSIVLMGVADADKNFLVIDVGARGKQSDGGIFTTSELFRRLENNEFNVPPDKILPNSNICTPHVLIGDEAFPLKPYLMRPFPAKRITSDQENFNTNLARARKTIECAFGILRAKWRFLGTALEIPTVSKINKLVQAACILHNIIRDKDGMNDPDYISVLREENLNELRISVNPVAEQYRRPTESAIEIRNKFMTYFKQ